MGRYLSIPVLALTVALSASVIPHIAAVLSSLVPLLENTRGQPSLVMLLVIAWSIRASLTDSLIWAFVGGIAMDLLSILPVGTSSFALILIAFAVHSISQQFYQARMAFVLAMTVLSTVFFQFFTWQALVLLGNAYHLPSLLRLVLLPTLVYNLLIVLPVYGFVRLLQGRLESALTQTSGPRAPL